VHTHVGLWNGEQNPAMSFNAVGLAVCFEKVSGWRVPDPAMRMVQEHKYELEASLSLSLFHVPSKKFFGTQWMGRRIAVNASVDAEVCMDLLTLECHLPILFSV
jgi:hypothetical protein